MNKEFKITTKIIDNPDDVIPIEVEVGHAPTNKCNSRNCANLVSGDNLYCGSCNVHFTI